MLKRKLNQAGETIIEVMIALSILGLVLGISYASASRSLNGSQDAQERTVASQIAQSMLEVVKAYALEAEFNTPLENIIFPPGASSFCVSTNLADVSAFTLPVTPPTDVACTQGIYRGLVEVQPVASAVSQAYEYKATVTWERLGSDDTNTVEMRYKWVRVPVSGT